MSEFYPTTTVTFYTTFEPFDDYDHGDDEADNETVAGSGIPMQIITASVQQYQPGTDLRGTTVKMYSGRCRGHHNVKLSYRILDERTGERYMIDNIDRAQNPMGDDSWVLVLRKVPAQPGQ